MADSPPPELPASHRWKCSSDFKTRLATVFEYYLSRLKTGAIDPQAADLFAGDWRAVASRTPNRTPEKAQQQPSAAAVTAPSPLSTGVDSSSTASENNNNDNTHTHATTTNNSDDSATAHTTILPSDYTKLALGMAKKAFEASPMFFMPEDDVDPIPAHCLRLDILSAPKLLKAVRAGDIESATAQLVSGTVNLHTAAMAFCDHASTASGDVGDDRDAICEIFDTLPKLGNLGPLWDQTAMRLLNDCHLTFKAAMSNSKSDGHYVNLTDTTVMFDSLPLSNASIFERFLTILLLSIPALSSESALRVCSAIVLPGGYIYRDELTPKERDELAKDLLVRDDSTIIRMVGRLSARAMLAVVNSLQNHFTMAMFKPATENSRHRSMSMFASALSLVHKANTACTTRGVLDYKIFHNGEASSFSEKELVDDFNGWLTHRRNPFFFSFSRYPCLCDAHLKSKLLQFTGIVEARMAQQEAMNAVVAAMFERRAARQLHQEMYCILQVRRGERLIEDTMNQIHRNSSKLRKPLKVEFVGEAGIDAGGVAKEFFQLISRQLLTPSYGMFVECNRALWFAADVALPNSSMEREFWLTGSVLGLAMYNNIIMDLKFPACVFRKLLGVEPDFEDLRELDPELASGLEKLLAFDEAANGATVEQVFDRNFTYEHSVFGATITVPLVPGGETMVLTAANRKRYVSAMVNYLTTSGVQKNFEAFKRGFMGVAARDMLTTMHPSELESLLCGESTLDINELEATCRYEGYSKNDNVIKWFWTVLHSFTEEQKRKFLHFCTGSDRVPVGGLKELHFQIGKNGDDDSRVPTASTCFNHFLLPAYSGLEVLRSKLLLAITHSEGFGLQ